jgi:membrane-associated phospholipid phosphatase
MKKIIIASALALYLAPVTAQVKLSKDLAYKPTGYTLMSRPEEDDDLVVSNEVYNLSWKFDLPITAIGAGWSGYALTKIYNKDSSKLEDIQALNKDNINSFDRWAAGMSSDKADEQSNYLFYGSMGFPFLLFFDKSIRKDAAKISFLYLEAMSITGLFYTGSTYFIDRYRPEAYNTSIPAEQRVSGNLRNSFPAGHVALVATTCFFTAKVYSDYHPDSRLKWWLYGGAAAATGYTIYLRHMSGKHFPSDIVAGTVLGVASGILVPHFHKNKRMEDRAWNIGPYLNANNEGLGLSFNYRFK